MVELKFVVGADGRIVVNAPPGSTIRVSISEDGIPVQDTIDIAEIVPSPRVNRSRARLSVEQAQEIRRLYKTGEYRQSQLAEMFNITQSTVSQCILGKTWNK